MTDPDNKTASGQGLLKVISLGCKVNQAEAAYLRNQLEQTVWSAAGQDAEVQVLLTCAVTASAARQSRQMVRRLKKENPHAKLIVTGCGLQAEPSAYQSEDCFILGRNRLVELPALISRGNGIPQEDPGPPDQGPLCPGVEFPGPRRTRGLLKVQDGCDADCAYCIVPSTRGRPRSVQLEQAVEAFQELGEAGAAEVVFTGIHLGRYGFDLPQKLDLADLAAACLAVHPGPDIRLSSLESAEVSDELIELLINEPRLCPHLHIPLQSGSDRVLKAMGRPYSANQFADTVRSLAAKIPGLCLGADLLVGLPGEDDQAFQETYSLVENLPLSYFHVFPYSPRPGTRAAEMPDRPASSLVKERAARLRELGRAKQQKFYEDQLGKELIALAESPGLARTRNYCLVGLDEEYPPGARLNIRVQEMQNSPDGPRLRGRASPL